VNSGLAEVFGDRPEAGDTLSMLVLVRALRPCLLLIGVLGACRVDSGVQPNHARVAEVADPEASRSTHDPIAPPTDESSAETEPGPAPATTAEKPIAPSVPEPAPSVPEPAPDHRDGVLDPLNEDLRSLMATGKEDPPAHFKTAYIVSNEKRHDLMLSYLGELGGAYVGVGSDQNYTLMGAARAEFAFLMDLDVRVTDVHRIYAVLIPKAENPEALREMFSEENERKTAEVLAAAWAEVDERERKRRLKRWRATRNRLRVNMGRVHRRKVDKQRMPTWMNDLDIYNHVRTMFMQGRVRWMSGDLTGQHAMTTIADICGQVGVPVTVLYLSNAEEYFPYTAQFRQNIQGLPIVEDSLVLRTLRIYGWGLADDWHYQIQALPDFQSRLEAGESQKVRAMLRRAIEDGSLERRASKGPDTVLGLEKR
jgi:hypothetical protein